MANFRTHVTGAALVSAGAAWWVARTNVDPTSPSVVLVGMGIVGGLLPDVDAETSVPSRWIRATVALAGGLGAGFMLWPHPPRMAAIAWGIVAAAIVHVVLRQLVSRLTVHRGAIHTVPFGALCSVLVAISAHRLFHLDATQAWWPAAFLGLGFLVHLVLDELASVDLTSARIKRSFGSALKLWDPSSLLRSITLYALLVIAWLYAPPTTGFRRALRKLAALAMPE